MKRYYAFRIAENASVYKSSSSPGLALAITLIFLALLGFSVVLFGAQGGSSIKEATVMIVHHTGPQVVLGSGVIISPDGNIITNKHVIMESEGTVAPDIEVILHSGTPQRKVYQATVKDYDTDLVDITNKETWWHDWAVLHIAPEHPLPYCSVGASKNMKEGNKVIAAGFPDGAADNANGRTVQISEGTISRMILNDNGGLLALAHTAKINHGNSGGPLCNSRNQLIGVNSIIFSDLLTQSSEFYAIPADLLADRVWKKYAKGFAP